MNGKIITTEEFIKKSIEIHNNEYEYNKVVYKNLKTKVCIKCKIHGEFWQSADSHLLGFKCSKCSGNCKLTQKNFIERSEILHNFKYDYSLVQYKNIKSKIVIICPTHGEFEQLPSSHLNKKGCLKCGRISRNSKSTLNTETFIKRSKLTHGNKYDYSFSIYEKCTKKVKIICPEHGLFEQTPTLHYKCGCLQCGNKLTSFKNDNWIKKAKGRCGIFYIIKCWNKNEEFYKCGITFNSIEKRYNTNESMPYNYKIVNKIESKDLKYIWELEKIILKFNKINHYAPKINFNGSKYECFI